MIINTAKNYYGLVSGLHDLVVGKKGDLSPSSFRDLISGQLEPQDQYQLLLPYYSYDNQNFIAQHFGIGDFNPQGNLNEEELTALRKNKFSEDLYFSSFLDKVDIDDEGLTPFQLEQKLTQHYYDFISEFGNEFLQNWNSFELTLKNLTTVYALRNLEIDHDDQFINGGYFSGLELKRINVADLDRQYPHLKRKYEAMEIADPIQRKLKVDEVKWDFLNEHSFFHYFTIEKIIAYAIKLKDLEIWKGINEETGNELLEKYIADFDSTTKELIEGS